MGMDNRKIGTKYERIAGQFLRQQGYEILEYNFRCKRGEIDIVAKQQGYLVFVEVKYRKDSHVGEPQEAVTLKKQKRISMAAFSYCYEHGYQETPPCRFDVVAILGEQITLIKDAFAYQGY